MLVTSLGRWFVVIVIAVASSRAPSGAQEPQSRSKPDAVTIEGLIKKHIDARGGTDAWHSIDVLSRHQPTDVTVNSTWRKPREGTREGLRLDQDSSMYEHHEARMFDGVNGWLRGSRETRQLSASEVQELREDVAFCVEVLARKELGLVLEMAGRTTVQGKPAWRVNAQFTSGRAMTMFFDESTGLEIARMRIAFGPDSSVAEIWTHFADFRKVGGLLLPHSINGTASKFAVNSALIDTFFSK